MSRRAGVSLLQGWLPLTIQAVAAVLLVLLALWLLRHARPGRAVATAVVAALAAAVAVVGTWWSLRDQDLQADPPPVALWAWAGLAAVALVLLVAAVARRGWWRRGLAVGTLLFALLAAGVQADEWVGYFPTVAEAYAQLTAAPLPDEVSPGALAAARGTPRATGVVVPITTPDDVSHFAHRTEYVYLPPAWFGAHPPVLPALMMVGGEFATPTDWIRTGDAVATADAYARTHGGLAPILVFADSTGSFRNDTECVDGPRGNAAMHLVDEVRPYVVAHFGAGASPAQWGVVGWSTGGTCAVDLGVTRPDAFSAFEDIQGDLAPNAGGTQQTLTQLYGGNAAAEAAFDPTSVLAHHAPYPDSAGWFADNPSTRPARHAATTAAPTDPRAGMGGRKDPAPAVMQGQQATEAQTLCAEATARGITCSVHISPGKHTWQFAHAAFADALPWLAGRLGLLPGTGAPTVRS